MPLKSYLIAPFNSGLQNNIEAWLTPEDAFQYLQNAYVWRGRVKKRFGTDYIGSNMLTSRLRYNIGTTDGSGDISTTAPGTIFAIGQMFSIGDEIFTVYQDGALYSTGSGSGTFNNSNGAVVITGASANTIVYYYPSQPVMGLRTRETSNNNYEDLIAFDTQFSYRRVGGAWVQVDSTTWSGDNSDFFWTVNYRGASNYDKNLYAVNYTDADNIKYLPSTTNTWTTLRPQLDSGATRYLDTAKIIVGFKDRLICLNTRETTGGNVQSFVNRARFSQNGDPTSATTSWLDDTPGVGGYIDCSTAQAINTVEFIKDRMIVYFERSTWELVYTGIKNLPFRWQQLNNELGAESPFSIVGFDKAAVGVGNVGVHSCNGVNVERIDGKIPNEVFKIHNGNNGPERVYGIRDYYRELVYWTFPSDLPNPTFPNRILVWNYVNDSWAFFDDSLTCFGYYQKESDITWADLGAVFGTWKNWNQPWNSARNQSQFPDIVAGNQQGFVFICNTELSSNEQSLYITNITYTGKAVTITSINHNLTTSDYVLIQGIEGITNINDSVYTVLVINANTFQIQTSEDPSGSYLGNGRITKIPQLNITSSQWNPGTPIGQQFRMPYMDFLMKKTAFGEVSVDYMIDFSDQNSVYSQIPQPAPTDTEGLVRFPLLGSVGSNVLYTKPEDGSNVQTNAVRLWHRYFLQVQGQTIQVKIFFNDAQMKDLTISQDSDVEIEGIVLYVEPQGRITG